MKDLGTLFEQSGIHICPVCGMPFAPYHSRQKTCGEPDCKRLYHNAYTRAYNRRRREEIPEVVRKYNRERMRVYRAKKQAVKARDKQLADIEERWERQIEFDRKIAEYGDRYGEVQAAKILQAVPKIDVNMGGKHDDIHDKDDRAGSE